MHPGLMELALQAAIAMGDGVSLHESRVDHLRT